MRNFLFIILLNFVFTGNPLNDVVGNSTETGFTPTSIGADIGNFISVQDMIFLSATTTQNNTSNVLTHTINREVIGIQIVTDGTLNPLSVTDFTLNTNGTTNTADITNAKLWYTGTSNTFSSTTQYGSTVATPSGSFNISGAQTLLPGTNYFWLTYDVPCGVTAGNVIDAECNSIMIGNAQVPSVQAPAGSRTIVPGPLSGMYTVGTGGNYTILTEAAADINSKGLSGNVQLRILNDLNEPDQVVINQWAECGGSGFTLLIRPDIATTAKITANSSTSVIKLNGADRVTIDGSNSGGTDRSLSIENTNPSANTAVIWISSLGNGAGAKDNIVRNCKIKAGETGSTTSLHTFGIYIAGTAILVGGTGADNDNITIQNNNISKAKSGIFARATSTANANDNLQILGNEIGSDNAAEYVTFKGIDIVNASGPIISGNRVFNIKQALLASNAAIEFAAGVTNAQIVHNTITGVYSESDGGWGAYGINFASSSGVDNNLIANNFISDIRGVNYSSATTTFNAFGIRLTGGTNTKIYFNTIHLFGDITIVAASPTEPNSANLVITSSSVTGLDVRNNIFRNVQTFISGTPKTYSIWTPASYTGFVTVNNNDYYGTDGPMDNPTTYHIGRAGTTDYTDLIAWQEFTTQDANSVNIDPVFLSDTDLHIFPGLNPTLSNLGTPLAGITTDIDGDTRDVTTPDIGGDEWDPSTDQVGWCNLQWPPSGTIFPHNTYVSYGQVWESGVTDMVGQGAGIQVWVGYHTENTNPATWPLSNWNPAVFNTDVGNNDEYQGTFPVNTFVPGTYYYAYRYSLNFGPPTFGGYNTGGGGFWDGTGNVNGVLTVDSCPEIIPSATPTDICIGESSDLDVSSSNSNYTYTWNPGNLSGAMHTVTPVVNTLYTVTATDTGTGCIFSSDVWVLVHPLPLVNISPDTPINMNCGDVQSLTASTVKEIKDYLFTPSSGIFNPLVGGINVPRIQKDDSLSFAIPIGFDFELGGVSYNTLYANSNGWVSFNPLAGTATLSQYRTNILSAPSGMLPLITPLWDDLDGRATGGSTANYLTEDTAPNRIFTFEWLNWEWDWQSGDPVISFQVKLYENSGRIELIYRDEGGTVNNNSSGASIGLMGSGTNFLMLEGTDDSPNASNSTFTTTLATKPATGQIYSFEPPSRMYLWSGPSGTLFTDLEATIPYTNEDLTTVYAKPNTSGTNTYTVTVTDGNGCENTAARDIEVGGACDVSLNLTAFIEGFMDGGTMRPVLLNSGVGGATASQADSIRVALHNNSFPYAKAYEYVGVLGTDGNMVCTFPTGANGGNYYIVVTHRSALETWSASPMVFAPSNNYSFASLASQAFGSNMVQVGSNWCLYSGDIDDDPADGNIDLIDYPIWETDYNNFEFGYFRSDLNGDGNVDLIDYPIWETNNNNFISVFKP